MADQFDNMALSDELIALIFADCLAAFPTPVSIDVRSIVKRLSEERAFENVPDRWFDEAGDDRPPPLVAFGENGNNPVSAKGDPRDVRDVLHDLLVWLNDQDFVRYEPNFTARYGASGDRSVSLLATPSRTVLTQKALAAMKSVPGSLDAKTTVGDRLKGYAGAAGKQMNRTAAGEIVKQVLEYGLG